MTFPPRIVDMSSTYPLGIADSGGGNPCNQMVIHFTVSGNSYPVARNLVANVQAGRAGGATQVYIDDQEVVITGPARRRYWATGSALGHNDTVYSIELCGGLMYGPGGNPNGPDDDWLNPDDPAHSVFVNGAWWAAQKCHEFEINPVLATIQQTKDPNFPAITTHYRISIADGLGGSDHTDWDDQEPINEFVGLVKKFYDNPSYNPYTQEDEVTPQDKQDIANMVWAKAIGGFSAADLLLWANKKAWEAVSQQDDLKKATAAALAEVAPQADVDVDALAAKIVVKLGEAAAK
jgi:hypothetical protein